MLAGSSARSGTAGRQSPATWVLVLVLGLAAAIGHGLSSGQVREGIYIAVGAASVLAILAAALLHRPKQRGPWLLLAAAQLLFLFGDLILRRNLSAPLPADALYLGAYVALVGALVLVVRGHGPHADLATLVDTAIISTTLGVMAYAFLLAPTISRTLISSGGVAALLYPLLDVLLVGALVHLALVPGRRTASVYLLGGALVALLAGDVVHTLGLVSGGSSGPTLASRTWWMLSSTLFGVAALHPSVTALSQRASRVEERLSAPRWVLLVAIVLLAPSAFLVQVLRGEEVNLGLILGGSVTLSLLVIGRIVVDRSETVVDTERRFLAAILENMQDWIVACDARGNVTLSNRAIEQLLGPVSEPGVGDPTPPGAAGAVLEDVPIPDDRLLLLRALHGEVMRSVEMVIATRDAQQRTVLATGQAVFVRGTRVGAVLTMQDITARTRAEESLRQSEQSFRALFEDNPQPMILWDPGSARFVGVNEAALALYGHTRAEFLELSIDDLRADTDPGQRTADVEAFREGTTHFSAVGHRTRGGTILQVEVTAREADFEGRPVCHLLVENVTQRLAVERALTASEQRFTTIFRSNPAVIGIRSLRDGRYLDVNDAFLTTLGRTREEVLGRTQSELNTWADPEEADRIAGVLRSGGVVRNAEVRLRARNGKVLAGLFSADVVMIGDEPHVLGLFTDLTERNREEALREAIRGMRGGVTRALASPGTLAEASETMLGDIGEAMGWDVGELWLTGWRGDQLRLLTFWSGPGVDAGVLCRLGQELEMTPEAGIAGRVREQGAPLFVADLTSEPEVLRFEEAAAIGLHQAVGLPITHDGQVVGAITFFARDMFGIDDALLAVLADLGQQVGQLVGRWRAETALRESARSFLSLFQDNPQPMFVWQVGRSRMLAVNEAALTLYGHTREEFLALTPSDLSVPGGQAPLAEVIGVMESQAHALLPPIRHRTRGGDILDVEITCRSLEFEGQPAWIVLVHNVTERTALQRELEHRAFHDSLTGLPNRALFLDRLGHARLRSESSAKPTAVLMLDIDNIKSLNDSLGHAAGDELLLEVSRRLAGTLTPEVTVCRVGGGEFGILLEELECETLATQTAARLLGALRPQFCVAGRTMTVGATIGIALSGDAGATSADLVRNADVALSVGKGRGKGRYEVFSGHMHTAALGRLTLEQELREGLPRQEFVLRYQPKVDSRTGRVVGVEALVRWNHPVRGLLAPDAFIAVAEESGLIVDLDAWVLETACRQAGAWARSAAGPLSIAVNVSGRDLEGDGLLERVRRVLAETGLDPRLLELELTESTAVQQQGEALEQLREIRALGVRIAIDDFGTGYSMLSRLQDFPIDTLKIDRSFISRITCLDADSPIVSATVAMARGLGLEVVAEGVETEEQRMYLVRQGCGLLQGYLISRPVEPERIPAMLRLSPLAPVENPRWAALESALGVAVTEPALEGLVRGLLAELQRLTGLDSAYLTRIDWDRDEQEILYSRNSGSLTVPEHLVLPWPDTISSRAPADGPLYSDRVPVEFLPSRAATAPGQQTAVSVPVLLGDGSMFGILCGASAGRVSLAQPGLEVMRIFAGLIAAQIAASPGDARRCGR